MGMDWPHTEENHQTALPDRPSNATHKAKKAEDDLETPGVETQSELKEQGHYWNSAEKLAPNRVTKCRWREFVNGLCSA